MGNNSILAGVKKEVQTFFDAVGKSNEKVYLILLSLYVSIYLILKIFWDAGVEKQVGYIKYGILGVVMWGSAACLFFVIAEWKKLWDKNIPLILLGAVFVAATALFSRKMSTNLYGVVMDVFFCIMAFRKDYRKILKCILLVTVVMLMMAGVGIQAGFSVDVGKPDTPVPGHSLGINYPNTWGYIVFLAMIIFWYLYLKNKPAIAFFLFWPVSVFMYKYITCRTIAGITLVFPVLALVVYLIEKHADRKALEGTLKRNRFIESVVTGIPFLAFAFMMFSSMQVDWWHKYYHGPLRNLAWRFIQGGLYFRTYGLPLIGNPYRSNQYTYVNVRGEFIQVGILDSSFAAYIIMRGMIWMLCILTWLCIAHWKALKKRDYAIILLETVILGFAMMERPGLEMWYNFILLYPLAEVISKPNTEKDLFERFMEKKKPDQGDLETELAGETSDQSQNQNETVSGG